MIDKRSAAPHGQVMQSDPTSLHGTCVARRGRGVLILGPSGSGKSDLALRLLDRGWDLVADDQVRVWPGPDGELIAGAPETLAGLLEIRGVGIVDVGAAGPVPVDLAITLVEPDQVPRMPEIENSLLVAGIALAHFSINGHTAAAPVIVERAQDVVAGRLKRVT